MTRTALFRCDASIRIGIGHVMRCMSLADVLAKHGLRSIFACSTETTSAVPALNNSRHCVLPIPPGAADYSFIREAVPAADLLIVDHYALDANWHCKFDGWARRRLVIDDLANRPYECDFLLDQTLGRKDSEYQPWVPQRCRLLLGPVYAMLRPAFEQLRTQAITRRRTPPHVPLRILISIGGTDENNTTGLILDALDEVPLSLDLTIVLGAAAPHRKWVCDRATSMAHRTTILSNVVDMAQLMLNSDLAIGSGGTTSWERCCLGLPALLVGTADNQLRIITELIDRGAAIDIGSILSSGGLGSIIEYAIESDHLMQLSAAAFSVCDGGGVARVSEILLQ